MGIAVPCGGTIVPCLSHLSPSTRGVKDIGAVITRGSNALAKCGASCSKFSCLVSISKVSTRGGGYLILNSNNTSLAIVTILGSGGTHRVIGVSHSKRGGCRGVSERFSTSVVMGAAPIKVCPGGLGSPLSLSKFGGLSNILSVICGPRGAGLVLSTRGQGVGTLDNLSVLITRTGETTRLFLGAGVPSDGGSSVCRGLSLRVGGVVLVNVPNSNGAAIKGEVTRALGHSFVSASRVVMGGINGPVPSVFTGNNRGLFEGCRRRTILTTNGLDNGMVSANNKIIMGSSGFSTLGRGKVVVFLGHDASCLPASNEPLSRDGSLGRVLGGELPLCEGFYSVRTSKGSAVRGITGGVLGRLRGRGAYGWQPRRRCTQRGETYSLQQRGLQNPRGSSGHLKHETSHQN